jgi:cytochrome c peroxidase
MAIVNLAWQEFFFWDGRSPSLEAQALDPIENPIEMNTTWEAVLEKLKADPKYNDLFTRAFGKNSITKENAAKAIAQFERMMVSGNSKFDKYMRGEATLNSLELSGMELFNTERGDCFHCHSAPIFGAFGADQFMNNGLDSVLSPNSGREVVTGDSLDRGKFKAPTLRNIEYSFPYMHDGRFQTLQEVIEHYNMGGHKSYTIDPNMKAAGIGRNYSQFEKDALIAFLRALSDPEFLTDTTFTDPW